MYKKELLLNVVHLQGSKEGTLYIREKDGDLVLLIEIISIESETFKILVGMVSAYNERYQLEKKLKNNPIAFK